MLTKSASFQLYIASFLLALSIIMPAQAETCPPANGKVPPDWTAVGNKPTPQPFAGAVYGVFGPTIMSCQYGPAEIIPINSYVLTSNFAVKKPDTGANQPWQWVENHITCASKKINDCQFTRY